VYSKNMNNKFQYDRANINKEKALLIAIKYPDSRNETVEAHLSELASLIDTAGFEPVSTITVSIKKPKPGYLIGSGKAEEIRFMAEELEAEVLVFDEDLTPAQQRNWERFTRLCVIDRREVILEIFASRAKTKEAVLQVALARMEYSLPRLTRAWTHLSRQRGGAKGTRGEGETQLEVDRRITLKKIARLKKELAGVKEHRDTMRKKRGNVPIPNGAVVGYTNAGKSSLLNALSGSKVYVENKLFATLDPVTKKIKLPEGREFLLTDTVGFIRKLPHDLVDAFKSTLEEAALTDFLIHVVDITSREFRDHMRTTSEVLEELGADQKPVILLFSKIDLCRDEEEIEEVRTEYPEALFFSAKTKMGEESLFNKISTILAESEKTETFSIPADRYDLISMIHRKGRIKNKRYEEDTVKIEADLPEKERKRVLKALIGGTDKGDKGDGA